MQPTSFITPVIVLVLATFTVIIIHSDSSLPAVYSSECNKGEISKHDSCVLITEVADSLAECLGFVSENAESGISEENCSDIFKGPSESIDINSNIAATIE